MVPQGAVSIGRTSGRLRWLRVSSIAFLPHSDGFLETCHQCHLPWWYTIWNRPGWCWLRCVAQGKVWDGLEASRVSATSESGSWENWGHGCNWTLCKRVIDIPRRDHIACLNRLLSSCYWTGRGLRRWSKCRYNWCWWDLCGARARRKSADQSRSEGFLNEILYTWWRKQLLKKMDMFKMCVLATQTN